MLQLRKNGRVVEVGGSAMMESFENAITHWNNETSGWDSDGNFWSITELTDRDEYRASREIEGSKQV